MSFKTFDLAHDVASIVSAINEVVSVSSSLFAPPPIGTGDQNIKFYNNIASASGGPVMGGYWQTVYDSAPASIQATPLFDLTFGFSTGSGYYTSASVAPSGSPAEKTKIYQELASTLGGSPNYVFDIGGAPAHECFFIMVKRGIMKDELKKGVTSIKLSGSYGTLTVTDANGASNYKQTVGGDYAPLFSGSTEIGQVWYNAGVIVIPAMRANLPWVSAGATSGAWSGSGGTWSLSASLASGTIDNLVSGFRGHVTNIDFQNQTNLYSTIYFCRATNTEFNYSSNPTYIDDNQRIRVTSGSNVLQSRTYITRIGLYDANDNLLAVGSVNKPITKGPDTEAVFRIRLDY